MLNKKVVLFALLSSCASVQASSGYWQETTVCDYKIIQVQEKFTQCSWGGQLNGFAGNQYYDDGWVEVTKHFNSHTSCANSITHTVRKGGGSSTPGYSLSGTLHLFESELGYNQVNKRVKDENSCRIERVWISCDGPYTCE
ncbi:hypothetical protein BGP78_03105 [Pseudoalteromonas sp. MSK9-3]|uniref:hypothetical protein n=1 Tax=Pseudoalteromonas sp. MSK9-3 TaxID=1897633 RepID=UPI000E6B8D0D|nr:hypothetical protein [Pseudoalteromonas sp. MSK9-3]RJE73264.1 hypothetical protein BGP78_03105 [Pseudoalteromonas sp. MSK9-3]